MFKWLTTLVVWTGILIGAGYLWIYRPQARALDDARRQASESLQDASALHSDVADLREMLEQVQQTSAELESEISQRESELASTRSAQDELLSELQQEIASGQIQVARLRGELTVELVDEVLFDSGEAEIRPAGLEVLKKVASVLKKTPDRQVIVSGHTDNVTITGRLARRYPTNWELSAARAVNVARFLQGTGDIDPARLSAAAFSEYQPRVDNSTPEGRRKNRRIEIVLGRAPIPATTPEQDAPAQGAAGSDATDAAKVPASAAPTPSPDTAAGKTT